MAENTTYTELAVGQSASIERVVTSNDLWVFARASGNFNPIHRPDYDIDNDGTSDAVAPSMWLGALFSAVLGNVLPGPGTLYLGQSLQFHGRARVGEKQARTCTELAAAGPGCAIHDTTRCYGILR